MGAPASVVVSKEAHYYIHMSVFQRTGEMSSGSSTWPVCPFVLTIIIYVNNNELNMEQYSDEGSYTAVYAATVWLVNALNVIS